MDYNRVLEVLIASIFGGGGTVSLINYLRARQSRKAGMSAKENIAVAQTKATPAVIIATPDWEALTAHWQMELKLTREEFRKYRIESDKQARAAARRIDELEQWIWERKPPPPPPDNREH